MQRTLHVWSLLGLLPLLLAPGALRADGKRQVDDLLTRSRAMLVGATPTVQPGAWVSYHLTVRDQDEAGSLASIEALIKISYPLHVDHEHPLAAGQFWMEFEFSDPNANAADESTGQRLTFLALKVLLEGDPRDSTAVKRMFIGAGGRRPWELGEKWVKRDQGQAAQACQRGDEKGCAKDGGKVRRFEPKKMYTKLGWLEARRVLIEMPDGSSQQMWISDKVPVLGFVRANLAHMMDLELDGFGSGALSRVDETQAARLPDPDALGKELQALEGE